MSLVGFKARNHPQQRANPLVDDRGTDPELFRQIDERFRFTVDVAALPHNAKLERYITPNEDGLRQSWYGERVWCNPPYSAIAKWVEKAWNEWNGGAELIVMLLPANRTEQGWWQRWVEPYRDLGYGFHVEFLAGRPRFVNVGKSEIGPNERPPFGLCLLVWS